MLKINQPFPFQENAYKHRRICHEDSEYHRRRKFFSVIDQCRGTVELVSPEGDRINLKSKLAQYLSMATIFSNGYIKELDLVAREKEDIERLIKYMYQENKPKIKIKPGITAGNTDKGKARNHLTGSGLLHFCLLSLFCYLCIVVFTDDSLVQFPV